MHPFTGEVADRLYEATGGNPLALLEVAPEAARFTDAALGGPVPVSRRITEAFLHRSAPLPERTRRALVLAAASDGGELNVLSRAAASIGLELADLTPGEAAGLVHLRDGVAEFRHPLARAAIYNDASLEERRQVHRALAGALPDRDADRRAWHLASAATGTDEPACSALQQAAERARQRGAYATSAAAFERAARLAPDAARVRPACCTPRPTRRGSPARSIGRRRSSTRSAARDPRGVLRGARRAPPGRAARTPRTGDGGSRGACRRREVAAEAGEPELGALMLRGRRDGLLLRGRRGDHGAPRPRAR